MSDEGVLISGPRSHHQHPVAAYSCNPRRNSGNGQVSCLDPWLDPVLIFHGSVRHLIFDEADRLLDSEFLEQIQEITAACTHPSLQKAMFSATLPAGVEKIAMSMLQDPIRLVVGLKCVRIPDIEGQEGSPHQQRHTFTLDQAVNDLCCWWRLQIAKPAHISGPAIQPTCPYFHFNPTPCVVTRTRVDPEWDSECGLSPWWNHEERARGCDLSHAEGWDLDLDQYRSYGPRYGLQRCTRSHQLRFSHQRSKLYPSDRYLTPFILPLIQALTNLQVVRVALDGKEKLSHSSRTKMGLIWNRMFWNHYY